MEALIGEGLEVEVEFDYDKGQEQINYPNDSAQEGIPESIEITEVTVNEVDIFESLNADCVDQLEQDIWAHIAKSREE
jgi:hypothetical protein